MPDGSGTKLPAFQTEVSVDPTAEYVPKGNNHTLSF